MKFLYSNQYLAQRDMIHDEIKIQKVQWNEIWLQGNSIC